MHRLVDAARKTTRIIVTRRVCLASDDFPGRTRNHRTVHTLPGEGEGKKARWASVSSVIKESSLLESTSGRLRWLKEGKLLRLGGHFVHFRSRGTGRGKQGETDPFATLPIPSIVFLRGIEGYCVSQPFLSPFPRPSVSLH